MISDKELSNRMHKALSYFLESARLPLDIHLWDGAVVSCGQETELFISIGNKGVIASLLKRPTPENLLRHYATDNISFSGGDLVSIGALARKDIQKKDIRRLSKMRLIKLLWPFFFVRSLKPSMEHSFGNNEDSATRINQKNKDYIQFHYDAGNDFYKLFLDPEMQYSCGYFKKWDNSLEQAQKDKLDMICKKLQLKEGESLLDIGCGWGGLICHAAKNYGVKAHGVTLSQEQHDYTKDKIQKMGLEDKVTVEIKDYSLLEGSYDKISSIGMFEHIGVDNFPIYFKKISSLLKHRGILLNHAIASRSKANKNKSRHKVTAEKQLLFKYIFPGSELCSIGNTLNSMEENGFEVHDVEAWREHYAITCKHWCQRLYANKEKAIELVGKERYNLWAAYLAGVSLGFSAGSILIFQAVTTNRGKVKGVSEMPPTREYLYNN